MIISSDVGLFGPYSNTEVLADRVRVWPVGSSADGPGADLPIAVIGAYEVIDPELPPDFEADRYSWVAGVLVQKPLPDPPPA